MRKSFKIVLVSLISILMIGSVFILCNLKYVKKSLFDFSIVEVMSLLTSVIIGFGLTYLVSVSFSRESKKNEVIEESLKDIKDDYGHLMQQFIKNRNTKITDNFRNYILMILKNIDKDISILVKLCKDKPQMKKPIKDMIKKRSDFNYAATGDLFSTGLILKDSYLDKCTEKYYLIKQALTQCKLELYNN